MDGLSPDSYPVAFRRQKRCDAEDSGKEMRDVQGVMGRTNSPSSHNPLRASKSDWVRVWTQTGISHFCGFDEEVGFGNFKSRQI